MFSLNGTLEKSESVGRWETKQFIGMAIMYVIQIMLRRFYVFVVVHKSDYFIAGSKSQKMLNSKTAIRQKTTVCNFHDQSQRKTANKVTCIHQIRMYVHAGIHTFLFMPCKKNILQKCIFFCFQEFSTI